MSRDSLFLLSLIALAAAALTVGIAGWVLWARDHRAWNTGHTQSPAHPPVSEGS